KRVALDPAVRPPLYRAAFIGPGKHNAAVYFASAHDRCHTLFRIYPHGSPALTLAIVEVDGRAVGLGLLVVVVRGPNLLQCSAIENPAIGHLAPIPPHPTVLVVELVAHIPGADQATE